jgi:hypothetical protein
MASWWDTVFGGGAQEDAAAKNAQALSSYGGTATGALATGYGTGTTNLNKAVGAYTPLANLGAQYSQAGGLLTGALGAGGPAGTAAAQAAFTNAPGYTAATKAGTDAILRQMGTANMSNSGNTAEDVGTFVQNLQNQQYNSWLSNLSNVAGMGLTATGQAAGGQAAGYGSLANLGYQYGGDQSAIAGNIASGTMADNNMVAAGQAAGAKNLLGAGLSLASLATGGVGGAGLGSMLKNVSGTLGTGLPFMGGGSPSGYGTA